MTGKLSNALLAQDIARVLQDTAPQASADRTGKVLLMAGVALAVMQVQPAHALTLGELRVQSALGEPFVGTTTARIGAGETINSECFTVPALNNSALGNPEDLTITAASGSTPGTYPVEVRTRQPLYEPMYEIKLQLQCTGTVALTKSYVVMLNLPMLAGNRNPAGAQTAPRNAASSAPRTSANAAPARAQRSAPGTRSTSSSTSRSTSALSATANPIQAGSSYRIRNGDTLSTIAERVSGRPVGTTWAVADMLFTANPRAFIRANPDMIKLGYELVIPTTIELQDGTANAANSLASLKANAANTTRANSMPAAPATLGRPEEFADAPAANATVLSESFADPFAAEGASATSAAVDPASTAAAMAMAAQLADASATETLTNADSATTSTGLNSNNAELENNADISADYPSIANEPTLASLPAETSSAAAEPAAPSTGVNPLIAILTGIVIGFGLALLLLGRSLLAPLFGRRKDAVTATNAAAPATNGPVADQDSSADTQRLNAPEENPFSYTRAGIDVELTPADQGETDGNVDVELFAPESAPLDVDLSGGATPNDGTPTSRDQAPRISLHNAENDFEDMLDTLAATEQFKMPPVKAPANDPTADSDSMRQLFEEDSDPTDTFAANVNSLDSSEGPTEEMPELKADQPEKDDLQSLSQLIDKKDNEGLSATLTQALDLLEQDYEDELSTSQILDKDEITAAFAKHDQKAGKK